ncbi:MAG: hypothetical protein K0Q48_1236 [Bacillota bacterium]|nr:hypothetical protein [Bacillota bacterium]
MKKSIDRIVIETIVEQSIQGFRNDPYRQIRKLADLGEAMANGRLQHPFEVIQDMLARDSSPYYTIISTLAQNFPSKTIQHFFINVGYNSWIKGARAIRLMGVEHGHSIPWTLIFQSGLRKLRGERLSKILEEARALGIYTFFFFTDDAFPVSEVLIFSRQFEDCAFVLLTSAKENWNTSISAWAEATNCIFLIQVKQIDAQTENILSACRKSGALFGLWMNYNADDVSNILNGKMTELAEELGVTVFMLVQRKDCDQETSQIIRDYVIHEQMAPMHAVFVADLYSDVVRVDHIISESGCMASVLSNGNLVVNKSTVTANLCMESLSSGLRKTASLT